MDLSAIQTLIGALTNDPNHDRYTTSDINTELDNTQDKWNIRARILKSTTTITVVSGTRRYAISNITGTPISFARVTHRGLELVRRDKSWFDLYAGDDWTDDTGTPVYYLIEATDTSNQYITLYPIPQAADAGANLVVEAIIRHTSMSASTDQPFNSLPLMIPYHHGIAYDAAARLLSRDPSPINAEKRALYEKEADLTLADVVETFKDVERESPSRIRGGRNWRY